MAEVEKSMSLPMALLDLRYRTLLETNQVTNTDIGAVAWLLFTPISVSSRRKTRTIERIYSGPDRALRSKSRKIVHGLPISVFGRDTKRYSV
jgi:hypothetical protein